MNRINRQGVKFIFGVDVNPHHHMRADELAAEVWEYLERPEKYEVNRLPWERGGLTQRRKAAMPL